MHNTNDLEPFNFDVELIIDALKSQNKALLESFKTSFTNLLGSKYTIDLLAAAVFHLSETDPDTCRWALRNFYNLKLHRDITEGIVMFATQKLINRGFTLGQDFSITQTGEIAINKSAKAALMTDTSASDRIFLEEVSQVIS